ncbi:MAG: hypothetical protein NTZ35_09145 [Ignavibacteriales bacterium]|nr:hypothetical protein [Ignavibacteriales bacterium]
MNDTQTLRLTKIDWRWLVVTYCFLVLFHLLPTLLELSLWQLFLSHGIWQFVAWTAFGVAVVGGYVGYRSHGTNILEPGIASMLYVATLIVLLSKVRDVQASGYRLIGLLVALHLIVFLVGCFGAAVGNWLKTRREREKEVGDS